MWRSTRSRCCPISRGGSERGAALPAAMLLLACLVGVTGWLVGHVRVDREVAAALADEQETARLAEAATQVAALALARVPDWSRVDVIAVPLDCPAWPGAVVPLDGIAETAALQAVEDAASRWPAETPRWRLAWTCHAPGVFSVWPTRPPAPSVAVWVADDVEGDDEPGRDTNQRLRVHGVAAGRGGARASATATIGRTASGAPVTLLAWRTGAGG
jgi:hypothetical protein